jgi:hypothetical protein
MEKGRGFYLIQSFEDWMGDSERVRASWQTAAAEDRRLALA